MNIIRNYLMKFFSCNYCQFLVHSSNITETSLGQNHKKKTKLNTENAI